MAKGISVGITSETQGFEAGVKSGVIKPLEDAAEAAEDAGTAGDKASDKLADGFDKAGDKAADLGRDAERSGEQIEDALRDAQRETGKAEREFKQLGETVVRESRDASRKMKESYKDATDSAGEGVTNFKDEAKSNASEVAASFDGSAASIADGFQGLAAVAFAGFGPAGIAAGIAAAAGIGLISTAFDNAGTKADELAEETNAAYDRMIEAGGRYLSTETENAAIQDVIKDKWKDIKLISDLTGVSTGDVARGYALGGTELAKVKDRLTEVYDANNEIITSGEGFTDTLIDQNGKIADQVDKLNSVVGVQSQALEMAKTYDAATGSAVKNRSDERDRIQDRNRELQNTPATVDTKLKVDRSELDKVINSSINVTVNAISKLAGKWVP